MIYEDDSNDKNHKPFLAMLQKRTEHALKEFLTEFPGHAREAEAQQAFRDITEGQDIVDLIEANRIAAETSGSGIQSVSVRIRGFSAHPVTVRIPAGTYFISAKESSQNRVATAMKKVELADEEWTTISVPAACANRSKHIPGRSDAFAIRRSPQQAELAILMPFLDKANVDYSTRQAAVWIVTDDADYDDLGDPDTRSRRFEDHPRGPGGASHENL
jgi:hypothetical protein